MRQPWSMNRALYGRSPRWFVPLIFGTVLGLGLLKRLARRQADAGQAAPRGAAAAI
jgi:hypothetical protein